MVPPPVLGVVGVLGVLGIPSEYSVLIVAADHLNHHA